MPSTDPSATRKRRMRALLRPWRALLLALLLVFLFVVADTYVKLTTHAGFCPADATLVAAAEDFSIVYGQVFSTDAGRIFSRAFKSDIAAFELAVRKAVGIRPTPMRWRLWLGPSLLASTAPEGVGFCFKPGILLRTARLFQQMFTRAGNTDSIFEAGSWFYAWRDAYLIVSPSRAYVAACLTGPAPAVERSHARDEVRIQLLHNPWFALHVAARNGLPVSGWINGALEARREPLTLAGVWPSKPLLSITGSHCREVAEMLTDACGHVPWLKPAFEFVTRESRLDTLPADWDARTTEFALALMDIDESAIAPVPIMALLMKTTDATTDIKHPLAGLVPPGQTIPFEWGGHPGVLLPWLTEKLTLCLARDNARWIAATQEPLMASLVGNLRPETAVTADMVVKMDWESTARKTQSLLMKAAENELVPFMNKGDVADKFNPLFDVAAQFGALRIEAAAANERVEFRGFLARIK